MLQKTFFWYSFGTINEEYLSKQRHYRELVPLCPSPIEYRLHFARNRRIFVEESADTFPKSISFRTFSPRLKFLHWLVSVYSDDPNLYEAHLRYQFRHACGVIRNDFVFMSFHDKSASPLVKKLLEEELQLQVCDYYKNKTMKLYETKCTPWRVEQVTSLTAVAFCASMCSVDYLFSF